MSAQAPPIESLAAALIDAQDQLLALYELAMLSATSLDESECTDPILERACKVLSADSLSFSVDTRTSHEDRSGRDSTVIFVENSEGLRGCLTASRASGSFGTADQKLLRAVAHIALAAVQTSRLHADAVRQAVVAHDHDAASLLAQRALPSWRPVISGLDFFARSDPAKTAGGDLFTFVETGPWLNVVVGDVSGKGLPAAIMMTTVISASNAALSENAGDPESTLRAIDTWVYEHLSDAGLFATLFACSINAESGELRMANAGHSPVLLVNGSKREAVEATAPPVGVLPLNMTNLAGCSVMLELQQRLAIGSDGLSEQANPDAEMYGEERLSSMVAGLATTARATGEAIFADVDRFAAGEAQSDDRTLVLIDRVPILPVEDA